MSFVHLQCNLNDTLLSCVPTFMFIVQGKGKHRIKEDELKTRKLPRGISDCENCLSKGFFAFPDEHYPSFVKCMSKCLIVLRILLCLKFYILIEVVYTDISAHWYFSSNLVNLLINSERFCLDPFGFSTCKVISFVSTSRVFCCLKHVVFFSLFSFYHIGQSQPVQCE